VVGNHHQVAGAERRVYPAARVRHEQAADAQEFHHPHRKNHLLRRVPFVIMETPLHRDDPPAAEHTENKPAGMSFDRRNRKIRYLRIVERRTDVDALHQPAEPGSENDPDFRLEIHPIPDEGGCIFDSF